MEHKELESDEIKEYEAAEEKEHVIEKRSKILAWLRMGIFSIFFYAFFFFAVVVLNILPTDDLYQSSINWIRDVAILPIKDIYAFIVPPDLWHNEATYITAALVLVFFSTGILCGNEKFQNFLFEGSAIKRFFAQVLIFFGLLMGFLRLFQYLPKYFLNILTPIFVLMAGAVIWLLYQTYALYQYSRSYSSSSESFLLKHDNKFTYFIVVTATFWGLAFIGVLGYYYFIFLDIVNIIGILLQVGVNTSLWELITWILGGTMGVTCLLTFIISISSKTNKRQRMYDNYSLVAANISLWPYILLNLAIYFIFSSSTIASMSSGTGLIITYKGINLSMFIMEFLSWIELIISIVIFVLAIRGIGAKTDWKFGILKQEGFILTVYGSIAGQYGIKYLLFRQQLVPINVRDFFSVDVLYQLLIGIPPTPIIPEQNFWLLLLLPNFPLNPYWNTFLIDPSFEYLVNMGNLITSVAVVGLLFLTFLAYALKKEKFGDLFRFHDIGAKKGRTTTDFIYDFMKREFNRRKEPFPLYEVEKKLAKSVNLDVDTALELINKADHKFSDLKIDGNKKRYVYFD